MKISNNQRGDTLLEVVIAIVIMGTILFSAYALSTRAFRQGQSARERTQATQLLQQQAEALHSLRDTSANWAAFKSKITAVFSGPALSCNPAAASGNSGTFRLEQSGGKWIPMAGEFQPGDSAHDPSDKIADFYFVRVEGCFVGTSAGDTNPDRLMAVVKVRWQGIGSSGSCSLATETQCETSQLYLNLADRSLPLGGT